MKHLDPTKRFSDRVENYLRYRPHYPEELLSILRRELGLDPSHVIADVGSGTGFLAELFLRNGNTVIGVEPNREMREAGEKFLERYSKFQSVDGTAEQTTLADASVDFVTAGQAFHWFEPDGARREFRRILRPEGVAVLVWNDRKIDTSPFLVDYENLLRTYATDYESVCHRAVAAGDTHTLDRFFAPGGYRRRTVHDYRQQFDFEGLKGRLLSSSYAPTSDDPRHAPMIAELRRIFDLHQVDDEVGFVYDTQIYFGRPGEDR